MTSRASYDINILRARDIYVINPSTQAFIEPFQIPMVYESGKLKWFSTLEFFSSLSIPSVSSSVLQILESVQPGISTMSTITASTTAQFLISTVGGLGSSEYVSTSGLDWTVTILSGVYKYISATTLYDVIGNLGDLGRIGGLPNPMGLINSNFTAGYGYVSTMSVGEYRIYKSSIGFVAGLDQLNLTNLNTTTMPNNTPVASAVIPIAGFSSHFVSTSRLIVDVMVNMRLNIAGGLSNAATVSSVLTSNGYVTPLGDPVLNDIPAGQSNVTLGSLRFMLSPMELAPNPLLPVPPGSSVYPEALELKHIVTTSDGQTVAANTFIGKQNGIWVTLDNTD